MAPDTAAAKNAAKPALEQAAPRPPAPRRPARRQIKSSTQGSFRIRPERPGEVEWLEDEDVPDGHFSASFTRTLAAVVNRPALLHVPEFVLKVSLGEASALVLTGQRAIPQRLQEAGFRFSHTELQTALVDLL